MPDWLFQDGLGRMAQYRLNQFSDYIQLLIRRDVATGPDLAQFRTGGMPHHER
jgi:hypothetical protein